MIQPGRALDVGFEALLGHFARDIVAEVTPRPLLAHLVVSRSERQNYDEPADPAVEERDEMCRENGKDYDRCVVIPLTEVGVGNELGQDRVLLCDFWRFEEDLVLASPALRTPHTVSRVTCSVEARPTILNQSGISRGPPVGMAPGALGGSGPSFFASLDTFATSLRSVVG